MKSLAANTRPIAPEPPEDSCRNIPADQIQSLSDQALLSRVFALTLPERQSQLLASRCLAQHQGFRGLIAASDELPNSDISPGTEWTQERWHQLLVLFGEIFTRALSEKLQRGAPLTSPAETLEFLQRLLQRRRREVFYSVFLDTRHRVICHEELFQGSIDGACVYPRVVAEHALRHNAAAVIVAHNHPSGVSEPSLADQAITRRLKDALSLLEIRLLDHFIIGDGSPVSLASRGMI